MKAEIGRDFEVARQPKSGIERKHEVELTYITTRGLWYDYSWKGQAEKSGGIATNIGVHFFDLLLWLFGYVIHSEIHVSEPRRMCGYLELKDANVRWCLSLEREDLPAIAYNSGMTTFRSIKVDAKELEFTGGFTDLHTEIYKEVIAGRGFGLQDAYASIQLVHNLRHAVPQKSADRELLHPILNKGK